MCNDSPDSLQVREHVTPAIERHIAVSGEHVLDHRLCSTQGVEEVTLIFGLLFHVLVKVPIPFLTALSINVIWVAYLIFLKCTGYKKLLIKIPLLISGKNNPYSK